MKSLFEMRLSAKEHEMHRQQLMLTSDTVPHLTGVSGASGPMAQAPQTAPEVTPPAPSY